MIHDEDVRHPFLHTGDVWFVDVFRNLLLGLSHMILSASPYFELYRLALAEVLTLC